RVANHLLGGEGPDPRLANLLSVPERAPANEFVGAFAGALRAGVPLVYLREKAASSAPSVAATALDLAGRASITVDLSRLGSHEEAADAIRAAWTEGLLVGASVIAGPIDRLAERHDAVWAALDEVLSRAGRDVDGCQGRSDVPAPVQFVLHGGCAWDPRWSRLVPLIVEVEAGTTAERLDMWRYQLGVEEPAGFGASDVTTQFLLTPDQIRRAVVTARLNALLRNDEVGFEDLRSGARAQNGAGLERLARRIHPRVGWDDLALAPPTEEALRNLAARARRRNQVLDEWGMRPGGGRGRGITVLFAGDSGTGKTMSAEVVAGDLGFDLYVVNLATVVDKYVGETEKNLERIFTEAAGVNAVLLFDEADAIFGKRSDVKDSNDRYANIEVAYLLQRMETFDGIAILATNLRANVDDAFTRRLDLIVDFPMPDVELRRALWDRCLTEGVPRADDLDLDFCARSFELSGGNIRSAAITAAYLAADGERAVTMLDLVLAVRQEYRKLGRLVVAGEFGRYFPFVQ
ncbi:MAG TPA: ATP-binding protein, partial [Acidimicrobiales bacterium]|nr:ATP-binding protein [Acidimicrobiales bacterium]